MLEITSYRFMEIFVILHEHSIELHCVRVYAVGCSARLLCLR